MYSSRNVNGERKIVLPTPGRRILVRYGVAIAATASLMIWQSGDAVRAGLDRSGLVVFWLVSVAAGWVQMVIIARGVRASFGTDHLPGWGLLLISALLGAIPLSFEIRWLVETLLAPVGGLPAPWVTYLNVSVINIVFSLIQYTMIEGWPLTAPADTPVSQPEEPADPRPTIGRLRRRPEGVHGVISYMQMQDHYLHVRTDQGAGLVLGRMGDAVADLQGSDGQQVHKSWWVSRAAVDQITVANRKREILLLDGTVIPVGRSFESALRKAGWF